MTAQAPDIVHHHNLEHVIAGIRGNGLLTPEAFGITPTMMSTGCYRGYVAEFSVIDEQLYLTALTVRSADDQYPEIDGVQPNKNGDYGNFRYEGLGVAVPFTGGLMIARDFIREMYVHMGFQKPTSYRTVIELLIHKGEVRDEIDYSEEMAQFRKQLPGESDGISGPLDENDTADWIDWTFSLDYDWLL